MTNQQTAALVEATAYGSSNSHTAILSRTMNLPAVVGIGEAFEQIKSELKKETAPSSSSKAVGAD